MRKKPFAAPSVTNTFFANHEFDSSHSEREVFGSFPHYGKFSHFHDSISISCLLSKSTIIFIRPARSSISLASIRILGINCQFIWTPNSASIDKVGLTPFIKHSFSLSEIDFIFHDGKKIQQKPVMRIPKVRDS